jgi:hypothetical protein
MIKRTEKISVLELRKLLYELRDRKPNVCIRYRKLGQMWKPNFMRVIEVNERGAIFFDDMIEEFVYLADLEDIIQFELDIRYQAYEPHFHYEVLWDGAWAQGK